MKRRKKFGEKGHGNTTFCDRRRMKGQGTGGASSQRQNLRIQLSLSFVHGLYRFQRFLSLHAQDGRRKRMQLLPATPAVSIPSAFPKTRQVRKPNRQLLPDTLSLPPLPPSLVLTVRENSSNTMKAYASSDFFQTDPHFGTLGRLPIELRSIIWKHVADSSGPFLAKEKIDHDLGILGTSRALREEFTTNLYAGIVLMFSIMPGFTPYDHSDFDIPAQDQYGNSDRLLWSRFHHTRRRSDLAFNRNIPFERLKSVKVDIEAPRPEDPGELLQSWNKLLSLVAFLTEANETKSFPCIEICAVETKSRKWHTGAKLHQSVPSPAAHELGAESDLELLLMPFRRLRGARGIAVKVPEATQRKPIKVMIDEIEAVCKSSKPFGTHVDEDDDIDDDMISTYEDTHTVWFDYILDDLRGPCAAMLRLARFAAWDVQYELGLRILIQRDKCDFGGTLLSEDQLDLADNALKQRYRAMRAWNLMSVSHVLDFDPLEYDNPMYSELDCQRARRGKDGWNMWMWWAVPYCSRGIPRSSS
jgi:hypothetical protein